MGLTGAIVLLTLLLIHFNLPMKTAFAFARPAMETAVKNPQWVAKNCSSYNPNPQNTKLQFGIYSIIQCVRDPGNYVMLITHETGFFSLDYHGFTYNPQLATQPKVR
ncbi:MAG: hypothetical protein VKJ24_00075, partial [Synechococcales bacterium]|nr:hypothetical protein [Synechococcales bacterium]